RYCHERGLGIRFSLAGLEDPQNADAVNMDVIAEAEREGHLDFLGAVPMDQMPDLLRSTDIVCLPSRLMEGFPRALLEAAACGCALVATDQPANRQIVQDGVTGHLIAMEDRNGLGAVLATMEKDRAKTESMGKAAHALTNSLPVGDEDVTEAFLEIYAQAGCANR
ncbi:MAG: glycosyltransferase, partial [Pseudomonadota bacterium]